MVRKKVWNFEITSEIETAAFHNIYYCMWCFSPESQPSVSLLATF